MLKFHLSFPALANKQIPLSAQASFDFLSLLANTKIASQCADSDCQMTLEKLNCTKGNYKGEYYGCYFDKLDEKGVNQTWSLGKPSSEQLAKALYETLHAELKDVVYISCGTSSFGGTKCVLGLDEIRCSKSANQVACIATTY